MERLTLLAVEADIAIMIAQHVRKSGAGIAGDGVAALRGSSAISDSARNAYGLSKTPPEEMIRIGFIPTSGGSLISTDNLKNNLGPLDDRGYYRDRVRASPGRRPEEGSKAGRKGALDTYDRAVHANTHQSADRRHHAQWRDGGDPRWNNRQARGKLYRSVPLPTTPGRPKSNTCHRVGTSEAQLQST